MAQTHVLHRGGRRHATTPVERRSMVFFRDHSFERRPTRVLTVLDQFTRLSPLEPRFSFKGCDVAAALECATALGRAPLSIMVPEFISWALGD